MNNLTVRQDIPTVVCRACNDGAVWCVGRFCGKPYHVGIYVLGYVVMVIV